MLSYLIWRIAQIVADIAHLKAVDFKLAYFLSCVYGGTPPVDSIVGAAKNITKANLKASLHKFPKLCEFYSFIRSRLKQNGRYPVAWDPKITDITRMGFTRHQALVALTCAAAGEQDVQALTDWILEHEQKINNTPRE